MQLDKKVLLLFNPKSGREEFRLNLFEVVDKFTRGGYAVTAIPTQAKGDVTRLMRELGPDYDLVVASGGDGTFKEALDGYMELTLRPRLGYIPSGTTNDFAANLGLPKDILLAADAIIQGVPARVDVGRFGEEYFSYVAAFGLFTDVPYATSQEFKNILGHAAYMLEGVKRLASVRAYACRVELGGETLEGEYILGLVSNASSVAGFHLPTGEETSMDDGEFEVILVPRPKKLSDLHNITAKLLHWDNKETDAMLLRRTSSLKVYSQEPLPWTLDGEFGGETDCACIANCRQALEIIVPPGQ